MSVFDPTTFLSQTIDEPLATRLVPVPEGDCLGAIEKLNLRTMDDGKAVLDITWNILDDAIKQKLGRDKVTSRQGVFLDIDANGKLATGEGKNVTLGRVRDAVGQNNPNQPWSVMMLQGAGPAKLKIGHRPDKNDLSIIYDQVNAVTKVA